MTIKTKVTPVHDGVKTLRHSFSIPNTNTNENLMKDSKIVSKAKPVVSKTFLMNVPPNFSNSVLRHSSQHKKDIFNSDKHNESSFTRRPSYLQNAKNRLESMKPSMQLLRGNPDNILRRSTNELIKGNSKYMITPNSIFRQIWDTILAIFVIYLCWMVPIMVSITWWDIPHFITIFNIILDICFFVDMILNFSTGIYHFGTIIMDRSYVAKKYLKTWFWIDFLSIIPVQLMISSNEASSTRKSIKLVKYVKLPKLLRISQLVRRFRKFQRYEGSITLISAFLFLTHIIACTWIILMDPCIINEDLFCHPSNIQRVYGFALHYSINTILGISMSHISSGDNPLCGGYHNETIRAGALFFMNFCSFFGMIVMSLIFGSSVFVVQSWFRSGYTFRKRLDAIHYDMDLLNLPWPLRLKIKGYYEYLWMQQRNTGEKTVLLQDSVMSEPLRREIAICMYKDLLMKIPFFTSASDYFLGVISLRLREAVYLPNDEIITRGEFGKELFILSKGIVQVLADESRNEEPKTLYEGSFFGEIALLMEIERTRTVIARTICDLCILDKAVFDEILTEFPSFATEMKKLFISRTDIQQNDSKKIINLREKLEEIADKKIQDKIIFGNNINKKNSLEVCIERVNIIKKINESKSRNKLLLKRSLSSFINNTLRSIDNNNNDNITENENSNTDENIINKDKSSISIENKNNLIVDEDNVIIKHLDEENKTNKQEKICHDEVNNENATLLNQLEMYQNKNNKRLDKIEELLEKIVAIHTEKHITAETSILKPQPITLPPIQTLKRKIENNNTDNGQ